MINESENIYIISSYIKTFIMNLVIYYSCIKMIGNKIKYNKVTYNFIIFDMLISFLHMFLKNNINPILFMIVIYFLMAFFISKVLNIKIGYSIIIVLLSYAISNIALMFGLIISFGLYKVAFDENYFFGVLTTSLFQFILVTLFFKIKRFKNSFEYVYNKFNRDVVDTVVVYLSIVIMLMTCFMGNVFSENEDVMKNMIFAFIIIGITMYIMIHRTITMQYKHSLLLKTLEEYKEEIAMKDKEIEKLSAEKFNTSKIRHEFYNRQKALELMVKQNMSSDMDKLDTSENILKIVNELTSEYSKECEIIKGLVELPKTDVLEIDNMFKYMQTECAKNNIDFKLNIQDSIQPLINNHISKSRLETLLGDHIRDAINAVNKSACANKEILVVLGLKEGNYEICILDNGIEFEVETLLKLGKEQVTTGGTGIGFLTTFETLRETKASLVITEYNANEFTKSISIVFNNKCEYIVNSYRAKDIKKESKREDIIINKIEG